MKDIENSEIAEYILLNNATVRETANHFAISRQTVSNRIHKSKNKEVKNILNLHFKYKSKTKYKEMNKI